MFFPTSQLYHHSYVYTLKPFSKDVSASTATRFCRAHVVNSYQTCASLLIFIKTHTANTRIRLGSEEIDERLFVSRKRFFMIMIHTHQFHLTPKPNSPPMSLTHVALCLL